MARNKYHQRSGSARASAVTNHHKCQDCDSEYSVIPLVLLSPRHRDAAGAQLLSPVEGLLSPLPRYSGGVGLLSPLRHSSGGVGLLSPLRHSSGGAELLSPLRRTIAGPCVSSTAVRHRKKKKVQADKTRLKTKVVLQRLSIRQIMAATTAPAETKSARIAAAAARTAAGATAAARTAAAATAAARTAAAATAAAARTAAGATAAARTAAGATAAARTAAATTAAARTAAARTAAGATAAARTAAATTAVRTAAATTAARRAAVTTAARTPTGRRSVGSDWVSGSRRETEEEGGGSDSDFPLLDSPTEFRSTCSECRLEFHKEDQLRIHIQVNHLVLEAESPVCSVCSSPTDPVNCYLKHSRHMTSLLHRIQKRVKLEKRSENRGRKKGQTGSRKETSHGLTSQFMTSVSKRCLGAPKRLTFE